MHCEDPQSAVRVGEECEAAVLVGFGPEVADFGGLGRVQPIAFWRAIELQAKVEAVETGDERSAGCGVESGAQLQGLCVEDILGAW